jgi:hypothetical protein
VNCEAIIEQLDDFERGCLQKSRTLEVASHLYACDACRRAQVEHRGYLQIMSEFQMPEPAPGKLAHMLRETQLRGAQRAGGSQSRRDFVKGFAAASLLAIAVLDLLEYVPGSGVDELNPVAIAGPQYTITREITVVINVPADMPAAGLALNFPEQLRLQGVENLPRVAWSVDLLEGPNVLTLPVTIAAGTNLAEPLSIAATVSYDSQRRDFQLPVELLASHDPQQGALAPFDALTPLDSLPKYHI